MTVFLVKTYTVKPDKLKEHNNWGKKLVALMKAQPDLFKGVKSMKVLRHKRSEVLGEYTAMWKFERLADAEKWEKSSKENNEQASLKEEFMALLVPGSYSTNIWEPIKTLKRKH